MSNLPAAREIELRVRSLAQSALAEHGLKRPTRIEASRHLAAMRESLEALQRRRTPQPSAVILPPGLDRSALFLLPFRVRTWNCLRAAELFEGSAAVTAERLLGERNFGVLSLRDVLLVVADFLHQCIRDGGPEQAPEAAPKEAAETAVHSSGTVAAQDDPSPKRWGQVVPLLQRLLAGAAEFQGAATLADVLTSETMRLASLLGVENDIRGVGIEQVAQPSDRLSSVVLARAKQTYASLSDMQRTVLNLRVLADPSRTLAEVAAEVGRTRERIRQIQARMERRVGDELGVELVLIATVIRDELGPVIRESEVDARVAGLIDDVTPAGALARHAVKANLGYSRVVKGICLDSAAVRVLAQVASTVARLCDDAGVVDREQLRASLPADEWRELWPLLSECCGLHDIFGSLALRNTGKARVKAAIMAAGSPVTRDELSDRCGLSPARVSAVLSSLPSVARADKSRWGLVAWIDDEYEGIAAEIVQRIEEDGGFTTTERLFEELPRKFGVNAASVRAYLQTAKFAVTDGHVSLADPPSVQLRNLNDVIDGHDDRGAPYWTFVVHERHLAGYSLTGVPPELAKLVGCAPDAATRVRLVVPAGCDELSVRWPLASLVGATIGYLAAPLRRLGALPKDRVRITMTGADAVEVALEGATPAGAVLRPTQSSGLHRRS